MLKLLVLISLQHLSSCCIFDEFAGPVLSNLRIPNDHVLQKRQVRINKKHASSGDHSHLNNYIKVTPQIQEVYSSTQKSIDTKEETDEISSKSLPLPPVDFMPEAQTDDLPPNYNPETDVDIPIDNPFINEIELIEILNDLSDCVELNRVQAIRLCGSKIENHKTKHISQFEKLTNAELESEIVKKCKTPNTILEKSAKDFKDLVKKNKASSDGNELNEYTPKESLIRYWNDEIPSNKKTIENFNSDSPHRHLQDGDIIINYSKQFEGDIEEPYIKDLANTEPNGYPVEAKHVFFTDITAEKTNKTDLDSTNQNISDYSQSSQYDTTTVMLEKLENDAPILKNGISDDMLYNIEEDRPSKVQSYEEPIKHNSEINASENLQVINGRRSFFRPIVNENEVPVIKIITHEYPDGNVVSKVNGTEILINNDSSSEENYTNVFVKNINVQENNKVTEVLYKFSIPKHISENSSIKPESRTQVNPEISFIGRLYLIHNKEKIPAQFIQESDGNISVGLDILSICETEKHDSNSVLFKILCKCQNCSLEIN